MKVSVITAVYNVADYIDRLLNSLESQTYKNWEFVAVDGQSTDGTYEKLLEFKDRYPSKVDVIKSPRRKAGVSFDRNLGLEASSSRFIAFIDGDDWWSSTFLEDTMARIKHHDGVFTASYDVLDMGDNKTLVKVPYRKFGEVSWREIVKGDVRFGIGNTLLRRNIIERIGLRFPEGRNFSEDTYFMMMYASQVRRAYGVSNRDFFHLIRHNSSVRSNPDVSVSIEKIDSVVANHKELCKNVVRYSRMDPEEFCRLFMEVLHPSSIMIYVTSISDSFGRKVGRALFKRYSSEIFKFRPTLSHSSLLMVIWIIDLFVPGFRETLRSISGSLLD
ncbi:glycosyltransferase family A protein [Thermococcus sp.]|uniref:glycosyltransferase family 2 protein n=1 Tax=Thermococcus sp. TaxID=35749 RepID=UPI002623EAA7|nr:glycosyltransferase family A protein [Thermococcus sp.]